ncbi:hypothetical protein GCM10010123_37470 [Pilimelia anulata]|uniref:Carrier domain-containing protein n=1 Tax=Pilimelia anulata TaxID=53371 RepID=A0A8J3FFC2_9ACTN|nr:phosphopantetheine-binding protein [Pilimelia anulata]GGK04031.1 hypothetical protein GCM10010123_37470 [Pilimelia anulata]
MTPREERVRAQIAELLEVPADGIEVTDDLIDHGLDSVRVMTLVETWRTEGAEVSFVALAEEPTVRAWAALLDAATTAG